MSLYLVAGHGASTDVRVSGAHLPAARARRYPSDTTDAEWQALAACAAVGITVWRCTKSKHNGRTLPASGTLAAGAGSGRDMCEDNDALFAEIGTRGEKGMDGRHHDGQPVRRSAEPGNVRGANIAKREVCEIARQYVMSTRMQRAVRQKQPDFAVPVSTRPQRLALSAEPVDLQLTVTVTPGRARPGRLHPCPRRQVVGHEEVGVQPPPATHSWRESSAEWPNYAGCPGWAAGSCSVRAQISIRNGFSTTATNAFIHCAATTPSMGRWSTDNVTRITVPTVRFPSLTIASCRAAPTARIAA
jgi:hypothetical protein